MKTINLSTPQVRALQAGATEGACGMTIPAYWTPDQRYLFHERVAIKCDSGINEQEAEQQAMGEQVRLFGGQE